MSRIVALNLLASALTILAAIALLGSAILVGGAPVTASAEPNTATVVHAFYDAVNDLLRTGDTAALERIVISDFVVHGVTPGVSPDRTGLERHLLAIHAAAPDTHLAVDELTVAGDRAIARVTTINGTSAHFLGVPLASQPGRWERFDAIDTEEGRVTALWTALEQAPLLEPLRETRLEPPSALKQVTLERLSGAAGSAWSLGAAFHPRVVYVIAGSLAITVDPVSVSQAVVFTGDGHTAERPVRPGTSATVTVGEALLLPPAIRYTVRHETSQPKVEAFLVAFHGYGFVGHLEPSSTDPAFAAMTTRSAELERRLLAAATTELRQEALTVSFGRTTLPPGMPLALAEVPGPLLLTVETGTLGVNTLPADPGRNETAPRASETIALRLAPGEATIVPAGALTTLYASSGEPASTFVVTILPSHAMPGAPS